MIYELLDSAEHPLVVVTTLEDLRPEDHPADCECGGKSGKALRVSVEGNAPDVVKALGLLTAVASLLADDRATDSERSRIRHELARLLEAIS